MADAKVPADQSAEVPAQEATPQAAPPAQETPQETPQAAPEGAGKDWIPRYRLNEETAKRRETETKLNQALEYIQTQQQASQAPSATNPEQLSDDDLWIRKNVEAAQEGFKKEITETLAPMQQYLGKMKAND